jgi:hypothetical protein
MAANSVIYTAVARIRDRCRISVAMPKLRVFLSHLTVEAKLADIISRHFSRDFIGLIHVFASSDSTSVPVGSKWLTEIVDALGEADVHMILCSAESVNRPWINFEAGAARLRGIPIIPICHTGFTPARLPVPLSESEGIEAASPEELRSLYKTIADMLGADVPDIDFLAFAAEIAGFEAEYRAQPTGLTSGDSPDQSTEIIPSPRVLCVSSEQFLQLGFENQLQIVLDAFPSALDHRRVLNSIDLRDALTRGEFAIVHVSAYVCPRTGDLYFSDVDPKTGASIAAEVDRISADALAELCRMANTRLVVVGSCDSLVLAASLIEVANVVAARDMVSARMMAAWVDVFYRTLPRQSLSTAFNFAVKASGAPMRLLGRQKKPEMIFGLQVPA